MRISRPTLVITGVTGALATCLGAVVLTSADPVPTEIEICNAGTDFVLSAELDPDRDFAVTALEPPADPTRMRCRTFVRSLVWTSSIQAKLVRLSDRQIKRVENDDLVLQPGAYFSFTVDGSWDAPRLAPDFGGSNDPE